ncbi:MAG: alanine--tRNA ligase [Thermoanaerobaculales bacterium]|jgi:alanyl-tRNA synthetase|nr:alanine--tRNA ligase [Thermoanaerobaculales bacterium]
MTSSEIRAAFLDYFAERGHEVVASSSLLPAGDSTLLFANAGMNQFKDVFIGREQRSYSRAASSQKCVRAGGKHNDLENVGYTARHHTFFEMLGNFSFGDYFKRDAIRYAWELLVDVYGMPVERLWFTVYTDDDEAAALWRETGAAPERILRFGAKDNYWAMGETGPCGPCSEIHFDRGPDPLAPGRAELVNGEGDDIIEIWNLVFMQFERDAAGELHPLPRPSIDTGAGLERIATVMQGVGTNYDTDLFVPILEAIGRLVERPYDPTDALAPAYRVIADHIRATTFLMTDGVVPSNEGRGYVLRRIIRRALRYGRKLGLDGAFLYTLAPTVVELMDGPYPELVERREVVTTQLEQEERRFARTLNAGTDIAGRELERIKRSGGTVVPGRVVFDLYQTHGIPVELLEEFAQEEGLTLDEEGFEEAMRSERERGQASWRGDLAARFRPEHEELFDAGVRSAFDGYERLELETEVVALVGADGLEDELAAGSSGEVVLATTPFYAESGGQVGDTGELTWDGGRARVLDTQKAMEGLVVHRVEVEAGALVKGATVSARVAEGPRRDTQRNHTATHLLHAALHRVLGDAAQQAGSLVEPERLRFDFSWDGPVSFDELQEVERLVNAEIVSNRPLDKTLMPIGRARELGAMALFGEKYGDTVRVVTVGDGAFSRELCGGCHVERTGDIGLCTITGERGVAAGVRRIEAVTGRGALQLLQERARLANQLAGRYQTSFERLPELLDKRERQLAELETEVKTLKHRLASGDAGVAEVREEVDGITVLARRAPEMSPGELRNLADTLRQKLGSGVVVLGMEAGGKATLLAAVTDDLTDRVRAGDLVRELAAVVGGRGGGKPNLAQAGGPDAAKLDEALAKAPEQVRALIS